MKPLICASFLLSLAFICILCDCSISLFLWYLSACYNYCSKTWNLWFSWTTHSPSLCCSSTYSIISTTYPCVNICAHTLSLKVKSIFHSLLSLCTWKPVIFHTPHILSLSFIQMLCIAATPSRVLSHIIFRTPRIHSPLHIYVLIPVHCRNILSLKMKSITFPGHSFSFSIFLFPVQFYRSKTCMRGQLLSR